MHDLVEKNRFGFYSLKNIPTIEFLADYYANKYHQQPSGDYQTSYNDEEIKFFTAKIEQKFLAASRLLPPGFQRGSFLDVGCGEGWGLSFFHGKKWEVTGLDFSDWGCQAHNPKMSTYLRRGDIAEGVIALGKQGKQFDIVMLDNVLEHVRDPLKLVTDCLPITRSGGILIIEVPNDFSVVQKLATDTKAISKPFWIAAPDHISYFNEEGLINLCREAGWKHADSMTSWPIDFNLFNPGTNYVETPALGKACHRSRLAIENLIHSISPEKANDLYRAFAALGIGRELTVFLRK